MRFPHRCEFGSLLTHTLPSNSVLTYDSASAVEWVNEKFGVDLSLVSRLGGHSQPRTHRGKEKFPGMTITYALMEKLEDLAIAHPKNVRIIKKARVTRLLRDASEKEVIGCEFEVNGQLTQEMGPVVLATGGYAADFTPDSLLKKYRYVITLLCILFLDGRLISCASQPRHLRPAHHQRRPLDR